MFIIIASILIVAMEGEVPQSTEKQPKIQTVQRTPSLNRLIGPQKFSTPKHAYQSENQN